MTSNTTARSVPRTRRIQRTGLESLLDFSAFTILAIGIPVSCLLGWATVVSEFSAGGIVSCCAVGLGSWFLWLILRWMAEVIRLQKQKADLPYDGHITGPYDEVVASCSNCGAVLLSKDRCDCCGARLVADQ